MEYIYTAIYYCTCRLTATYKHGCPGVCPEHKRTCAIFYRQRVVKK